MSDVRFPDAEQSLPVGPHPDALAVPHFPDSLHALVWRNWQLIEPGRLAEVVGTTAEKVTRIATSMGLPASATVDPHLRERALITIVRRNWHLLPYDQLLQLLGRSAAELAFSLSEDDFLFIKLGSLKPKCEPVRYGEPDDQARERAAQIKRLVEGHFADALSEPAEPRFHFAEQLGQIAPGSHLVGEGGGSTAPAHRSRSGLHMVYSYFGAFGDPLSDAAADPYPDGLLSRLARAGVNGVWMHVVLRQLAPGGEHFPEFGEGHRERLANLRRLVEKTKKFGIGIYLYINEPRAMPPDFFDRRPEMAGIRSQGLVTMCTCDPRVRYWITDAMAHLFRQVRDLAGVFTITASENPTNCAYAGGQAACGRCRGRSQAEIVAEVNAAIEAGVHRGSASARVIAYDWGWNDHGDAPETIARLPDNVELMSVSEWALPIQRGGVSGEIGEYSLSAVGPGPRATRHWELARQRGLKTVAKVQLNNSWELSTVPFLPVLDLVAEHCENLALAGVDGAMLGWSLGGYPSPNLQVAHRFATTSGASKETVLEAVAAERYGIAAAPHARRAWTAFSDAFRLFPFDIRVLYFAPQQLGPANLLYRDPTGYKATMVGIPYDDVDGWRGPYPAETLADQFEKMVGGWAAGLRYFEQVVEAATGAERETAEADLGLARAVAVHFASTGNQVRFVLARNRLREVDPGSPERNTLCQQLGRLLDDEIALARELFTLAQKDSRLGFEALNHYFYVPVDLMEKVINCDFLRRNLVDEDRVG